MYSTRSFWFKQETAHSCKRVSVFRCSNSSETVSKKLVFSCSRLWCEQRVTSRSPTKRGRAGPEHSEGRTATRVARPRLEWTEQKQTRSAPVQKGLRFYGLSFKTRDECATRARRGCACALQFVGCWSSTDSQEAELYGTDRSPRTQPLSCLPSTVYQTHRLGGFEGVGSDAATS